MKTYKISEVLYWTIAGISIYKIISLWGYDQTEHIISLVLLFCQFYGTFRRHFRKNIIKGTRTLNDSF